MLLRLAEIFRNSNFYVGHSIVRFSLVDGLSIACTLRIVSFLLPLTAWVFRFFVCTQAPVYLRLWMNTRNRIPKVRFRFCTARKCVQIREVKGRKPLHRRIAMEMSAIWRNDTHKLCKSAEIERSRSNYS